MFGSCFRKLAVTVVSDFVSPCWEMFVDDELHYIWFLASED